jgi:hypothetical protein
MHPLRLARPFLAVCTLVTLVLIPASLAARSSIAIPQANTSIYLPLIANPARPILAANLEVEGYSLEETALQTAAFNVSLDPSVYPDGLPFQILNTAGDRSFIVKTGTFFYIPIAWVDDSPPVLGTFPSNASAAQPYFFAPQQLGGHDFSITIDGIVYSLDGSYLAGPVTTAPLPDGGGTHFLVIAAFMAPLDPGDHVVQLKGALDGTLVIDTYGAPYLIDITYMVKVNT